MDGKFIGLGVAFGAAFGAAFDNVAIGTALGIILGALIGALAPGAGVAPHPAATRQGKSAGVHRAGPLSRRLTDCV